MYVKSIGVNSVILLLLGRSQLTLAQHPSRGGEDEGRAGPRLLEVEMRAKV